MRNVVSQSVEYVVMRNNLYGRYCTRLAYWWREGGRGGRYGL